MRQQQQNNFCFIFPSTFQLRTRQLYFYMNDATRLLICYLIARLTEIDDLNIVKTLLHRTQLR